MGRGRKGMAGGVLRGSGRLVDVAGGGKDPVGAVDAVGGA